MANILWIIHNYPPYQNAGAEWMAKEMNDYLKQNDNDVIVSIRQTDMTASLDTVNRTALDYWLEWADIIITHLDDSYQAQELAEKHKKPIIHVIHHSFEIPLLREPRSNTYLVYNSQWIQEDRKYPNQSIIVRPPVNVSRFKGMKHNPNGYITLVNCNKDKGGVILQNIAKAMPDKQFLGVLGAHGPQVKGILPNLTYWDTQADITKVFEQTNILIVPSVYESYGRIAIEAASCGIPIVCADTPGLRESLGDAGTFVSRKDFLGWLHALRTVTPNIRLKQRAAELWRNSQEELYTLNNFINSIVCQ